MITVCIPTIPPRADLLARAVRSVQQQIFPASAIHIESDHNKTGAGATRNRALHAVRTEWTAFLDDDDELLPQHLSRCLTYAEASGADLVYPWFDVIGGDDPFPAFFGMPFNPNTPNMFPVTIVAKTEVLQRIAAESGGFGGLPSTGGEWQGDDWPYWLKLNEAGAVIRHLPERTWLWHHDSGNTSGLPDRW